MTILIIILLAIVVGLSIGLYFQMKASRKQATDQEQLLKDYQQRVNEQQKLLDDYRTLEKNFDNVGEGYEQALLAFDKMEEESQKQRAAYDALEKRSTAMQSQLTQLQDTAQHRADIMKQLLSQLRDMATSAGDMRLMAVVGKISDLDDIQSDLPPIAHSDNELVTRIVEDAVKISGIDKSQYLKFNLSVADDAAVTMISTSRDKATRALVHLLDNALKFTSDGSVSLNVSVDMEKMQVTFAIEDTGTGIDAGDAERIFEPYVKLNQFFDGNGIGLTIARNIARRLGGDIVLDTAFVGPGSRFVLTLPI